MCSATSKQIGYAVLLLRQAGYSIERMDSAAFAELGTTMRERSGTFENWLKGMNAAKASRLIKRLKWECRLNKSVQRMSVNRANGGVLTATTQPSRRSALLLCLSPAAIMPSRLLGMNFASVVAFGTHRSEFIGNRFAMLVPSVSPSTTVGTAVRRW